jgi:hypothetical protein
VITRRGVAAFALFAAGIGTGATVAAQSAADALSTGYGGAELSCFVMQYAYPQYGITGVITYCGPFHHAGGWS